jgi:hypothetical protein
MNTENLNHTTPEQHIPAVTIPAKTYIFAEELEKAVLTYMEDRYHYLAAGRHPLDDLSRSSYIKRVADIFTNVPYEDIENHFDALGEKITSEKEQKQREEYFEHHGIDVELIDGEILLQSCEFLRERFLKNRPTKGWNTNKMDKWRLQNEELLYEELGLKTYTKSDKNCLDLRGYEDIDILIHTDGIFPRNDWEADRGMESFYIKAHFPNEFRWAEQKKHGSIGILEIYYIARKNEIRNNTNIIKIK